ncbi:MAG: ABC transporter substrate-binding protein [Eubacterium sp.]|nr:ABC transporter substrate-binding protein [Eubacterium sp.]
MTKRITAFLLCAVIIASVFSACSSSDPEPEQITQQDATTAQVIPPEDNIPPDDTTFKLSYTQTDSLNPYKSNTLNNQIIGQLVFDGLFKLDGDFNASPNIAESYRYPNSKTLEVTIKSGQTFSDGSLLTADDITYSFKQASASSYWGNSLNGISSCSAASNMVVVFKLKYPNAYAHNLLSFPIVSTGKNEDGFPIGSGRYYFAKESGETVLKANTQNGFSPYLTTIHLENITAYESIDNAVNIGNISFAFRDLGRDSSRNITSAKRLVNMNNLVYLGVNNKKGITANAYIRKAISLALDRETLVRSPYNSFAREATTVFHPQFELSTTRIFDGSADINGAKQAIAQSGVSKLSLSLLVNGENADRVNCAKTIKQQLEAVGFSVNLVIADSFEKYEERIKNESFDLYLGEAKITDDMSLNMFFSSNGATNYGIDSDKCKSAEQYEKYINGEADLGAFLLAFSEEMPYIPLLYREGMICYSKAMKGDMQGTYNDCFANIENWYFKS